MMPYQSLLDAGASVATLSGVADGDCGWGGVETGERAAFLSRAGASAGRLVALRQCHGDDLLIVTPEDAGRGALDKATALGDGDGLMTCHPGIPLGITVADCVPVFFAARAAVALVHAGREGTLRGIAGKAARLLCTTYGIAPDALFAVIGPSAGPCCYEVSGALRDTCVAAGMLAQGNNLDLWASNRQQLREAGLPPSHIGIAGTCTICQAGHFSYRGQRTEKRNLALIMR